MQRLLHEGEKNFDIQDECVPSQLVQKFRFCLVGRKPVFHPIWRFRGWCGGTVAGVMPEYGEYPSGALAAGRSKNTKQQGLPSGPLAV